MASSVGAVRVCRRHQVVRRFWRAGLRGLPLDDHGIALQSPLGLHARGIARKAGGPAAGFRRVGCLGRLPVVWVVRSQWQRFAIFKRDRDPLPLEGLRLDGQRAVFTAVNPEISLQVDASSF